MVVENQSCWYVYLLKCNNASYYTGATNDLENRVAKHQSGNGAKYTRSHLPVELVYAEEQLDQSSALKREYEIKQLTHQEKKQLIKSSN